ncbi:MAG TPA: LUD domain-containing protein [Pararobbsia sp.]|nr:LUD domain-containing protein [Pararobbsia sp.]
MSSRDSFLAKIRAAQPAPVDMPDVPLFATPDGDRIERFIAGLALYGGVAQRVASTEAAREAIYAKFGENVALCSVVDAIPGTRAIDRDTAPASLHDVEVAVVPARFGVAETGSVFLSEVEYRVNSIGYLAQHLVIVLDERSIVDGLQDAYRRDDFNQVRYAALVTGPSATADIEGVLVRGAQGVRSLTIMLVGASA